MRAIRVMVNEALSALPVDFARLYSAAGLVLRIFQRARDGSTILTRRR